MKRFLVFACEQYYPNGGWRDLRAQFDALEEAVEEGKRWDAGGYSSHVVDLQRPIGQELVWE